MLVAAVVCLVVVSLMLIAGPARASGFVTGPAPDGPVPWTHLNPAAGDGTFHFAILADRSGGIREGRMEHAIARLNLLRPAFVVHIGDIIEGAAGDRDAVNAQWDEVTPALRRVEAPLFLVPGNHDVLDAVQQEVWGERFGPLHYHFVYEDTLFLVLNSEDPPSKQLSEAQVAWAAGVLARHDSVRWTFVFVHVPLWIYPHDHRWDRVEALLEGRPHTVFAGHMHEYTLHERNGAEHIVLAASGAWTHGRGPEWGEFDHVTWVSVGPGAPRIANIATDGLFNARVRTGGMRDALEPVRWGEVVTSSGVRVEGPVFNEGTATLLLRNPLDRPVVIQARVHPSRQVRVRPMAESVSLEPGALREVPVRLEAPVSVLVDDLDPVRVDWELTCAFAGREPVVLRGTHRIVLDGDHACPRRAVPVTVDGRLDEWEALPFRCVEPGQVGQTPAGWSGPGEASFEFATAWDDDFLYVAVRVIDGTPRHRARTEPWRKDGLVVRIDARPDGRRAVPRERWLNPEMNSEFARYYGSHPGPGAFDDYLYVGIGLGATPDVFTVYQPDRLPEGVRCACAPCEGGYAAEIAVPAAWLDAEQGGPWRAFRMNLTVFNYEGIYAAPCASVWWRPEWNSAEDVPGSGTFRRA